MNQLIVDYKFGHQRIVNLDKSFFEVDPYLNKKFGKFKTQTSESKAIELANYLDPNPYKIELIRDGKTVITHTYPINKPDYGINNRSN